MNVSAVGLMVFASSFFVWGGLFFAFVKDRKKISLLLLAAHAMIILLHISIAFMPKARFLIGFGVILVAQAFAHEYTRNCGTRLGRIRLIALSSVAYYAIWALVYFLCDSLFPDSVAASLRVNHESYFLLFVCFATLTTYASILRLKKADEESAKALRTTSIILALMAAGHVVAVYRNIGSAAYTAAILTLANASLFIWLLFSLAKTKVVGQEDGIRTENLSRREIEIVDAISKGWTNKRIASELNISEGTVRTHIYNIFQKRNVNSRIELLNDLKKRSGP